VSFFNWSGIKSSLSKIANNKFVNNISSIAKNDLPQIPKKQLPILVVSMTFLISGLIGISYTDAAVSTAEMELSTLLPAYEMELSTLLPAYEITLDGTPMGYVTDAAPVESMIDQVRQQAETLYGMDSYIPQELSIREVTVSQDEIIPTDNVVRDVIAAIDIKAEAYSIYADDVLIGIVKSRQDADKLLSQIKAQYVDVDQESQLENVAFKEELKILFTPVSFKEVKDVADIVAEINKGVETVEEYTISAGDTLWSISRAYDMDLDTIAALNSDIEDLDKLKLGQKIRLSYPKSLLNVVTTQLAEYEETIAYDTEYREDNSMYKNQSKTLQEGKEGLKYVEARIIKVNGLEDEREILSEQILEEPVTKIVAKGTKTKSAMASRGGGALLWPTRGRLTSGFGRRWGRNHNGIDIANSSGTPIYAAEPGKVISSGRSGGYGNLVKIDHGGGLVTYYAHLKSSVVSTGQRVDRGQLIGYMGNTGNSTGSHLHFEVRVNNKPMNPLNYLP
jgi:murein DD-endopeptidase MepM/ murein hydrolase activator NlpD